MSDARRNGQAEPARQLAGPSPGTQPTWLFPDLSTTSTHRAERPNRKIERNLDPLERFLRSQLDTGRMDGTNLDLSTKERRPHSGHDVSHGRHRRKVHGPVISEEISLRGMRPFSGWLPRRRVSSVVHGSTRRVTQGVVRSPDLVDLGLLANPFRQRPIGSPDLTEVRVPRHPKDPVVTRHRRFTIGSGQDIVKAGTRPNSSRLHPVS